MPLPVIRVTEAVELALEKSGVLPTNNTVVNALNSAGADIERLATELANLAMTAREGVRLNAVRDALRLHGIDLNVGGDKSTGTPQITIQVVSEKTNLNNVFAPERNM
jgi:hypothetical protein